MIRDSVRFRFALAWPQVGPKGVQAMHLDHTAIPVFSVAMPPMQRIAPKPYNPAPRYPFDARERGYTAIVMMDFVVDTAGHAVMATVHDEWGLDRPRPTGEPARIYDEFRDAVRSDLADIRFYPASAGDGCRFDEFVRMPFVFTIGRRP